MPMNKPPSTYKQLRRTWRALKTNVITGTQAYAMWSAIMVEKDATIVRSKTPLKPLPPLTDPVPKGLRANQEMASNTLKREFAWYRLRRAVQANWGSTFASSSFSTKFNATLSSLEAYTLLFFLATIPNTPQWLLNGRASFDGTPSLQDLVAHFQSQHQKRVTKSWAGRVEQSLFRKLASVLGVVI
jgi:hypothetical protein